MRANEYAVFFVLVLMTLSLLLLGAVAPLIRMTLQHPTATVTHAATPAPTATAQHTATPTETAQQLTPTPTHASTSTATVERTPTPPGVVTPEREPPLPTLVAGTPTVRAVQPPSLLPQTGSGYIPQTKKE